jgi:hypothetical protein
MDAFVIMMVTIVLAWLMMLRGMQAKPLGALQAS